MVSTIKIDVEEIKRAIDKIIENGYITVQLKILQDGLLDFKDSSTLFVGAIDIEKTDPVDFGVIQSVEEIEE